MARQARTPCALTAPRWAGIDRRSAGLVLTAAAGWAAGCTAPDPAPTPAANALDAKAAATDVAFDGGAPPDAPARLADSPPGLEDVAADPGALPQRADTAAPAADGADTVTATVQVDASPDLAETSLVDTPIGPNALAADSPESGTVSDANDGADAGFDAEVSPADVSAADADAVAPVQIEPKTLPPAPMVEVTTEYGFDPKAVHQPCVAVADFDGNGRQDFAAVEVLGSKSNIHAVLLGPGAPAHVSSKFDTTVLQANFGCTAADMNADGMPDLLFGGFSGVALYLGNGQGGFVDKTAQWMPYVMDFSAFSMVPADLDGDGDLDLYIGSGFQSPNCASLDCAFTATDLVCKVDPPLPMSNDLQDRVLIHGPTLPLVDATEAWNVPGGGSQTVAMALDVDADGKMDVLVGDDFGSSRLLHNTGKSFQSWATAIGMHEYSGSMGWTAGDFDSDGKADLVLAEGGPTPLYMQVKGKPGTPVQYEDQGGKWGVWSTTWGSSAWSPIAADFDHNGLDDLLVGASVNFSPEMVASVTGFCSAGPKPGGKGIFIGQTSIDVLYLNLTGKGFEPYALPPGKYAHIVFVDQQPIDLDGDGDLDIVQTRPGASMNPTSLVRILRNDWPKQGPSLTVIVTGKGGNTAALGAIVSAKVGGITRTRWLAGSGAFGGTPSRFAHFGLGAAGKATDITVTWPDGTKTVLGDGAAGATLKAVWK
ncbi:MAG: CRTAC1 family protein [Myxococcales bacterium]|nr:CRTAC1 family protein [Myxococcales bacterium]